MHVWPCAPVLAQYLWYHRAVLPDKRVLELGAGTSLPGVVAAKCGASVILSDASHLPSCLRIAQLACTTNGLDVPVVGLTWGLFTPPLLSLPPLDYVIASDCFYDPSVFEEILVTVSYLLDKNPGAYFICAYQERACDWSLEALLLKWDLRCSSVPLHS
ncbi:Lysine methyltransferase, partial [Trinorchestia longiramus]